MARAIASVRSGNFLVMSRAKSFLDLGNDRVRIFLARIVGSDDGVIRILIGHPAHERTLLPVAIAAATEDDNEVAAAQVRAAS